jgi:hypothetical protein
MKKLFLLLIPAVFIISSCGKGCIDPNASNYDVDAKKDNGKCTYESTLTLWYDQTQSITWDQSGVTSINVYVGEVLVVNHPVATYWVTAPDCAETGTINVLKNLGADASKTITWEVKDQADASLKTGSWSATGGACDVVKVQ